MSRTTLDDLLGRSMPRLPSSTVVDQAAVDLAAATLSEGRARGRMTRLAVGVAAAVAALSLTVGTAVAGPGISDWWLWMPEADILLTTEPFVLDGETVTCNVRMAVLTDGKTADDSTVQRLYQARMFLQTVRLDDYQTDAAKLMEEGYGDSPMPDQFDRISALAGAIVADMDEQGLIGAGVAVDVSGKCPVQ